MYLVAEAFERDKSLGYHKDRILHKALLFPNLNALQPDDDDEPLQLQENQKPRRN